MKRVIGVLFIVLMSLFAFNSCKKGADDPEITLLTRKARLTGEWTMTSGHASLASYSTATVPYVETFTFNGGNGYLTNSYNLNAYYYKYNLSLTINRDGTCSMIEDFNGQNFSASGTWNFTHGVGKETKNKEEITIKLKKVNSSVSYDHLFNQLNTTFTYKIRELRNKKLVLTGASYHYINANGESGKFEGEYIFNQ